MLDANCYLDTNNCEITDGIFCTISEYRELTLLGWTRKLVAFWCVEKEVLKSDEEDEKENEENNI